MFRDVRFYARSKLYIITLCIKAAFFQRVNYVRVLDSVKVLDKKGSCFEVVYKRLCKIFSSTHRKIANCLCANDVI